MIIYLVRHGSTDLNESGRLRGWLDVPLSKKGIEEAQLLKDYFRAIKINKIYSSDLVRAYTTAETIARDHHLKVGVTKDLRPIDFGDLNGQLYDRIELKLKALFKVWQTIPAFKTDNGESFDDFQSRIYPFIRQLFQNKPDTIAIVGHVRDCLYILALAMNNMRPLKGLDLEMLDAADIGTGNIATLEYVNDRLTIKGLNLIDVPGEAVLDKDNVTKES